MPFEINKCYLNIFTTIKLNERETKYKKKERDKEVGAGFGGGVFSLISSSLKWFEFLSLNDENLLSGMSMRREHVNNVYL